MGGVVIVKLFYEGFSIGMFCVEIEIELMVVVEIVLKYDKDVLIECWINGVEFICVILNGVVLLVIWFKMLYQFYDFDVKYELNIIEYLIFVGLEFQQEQVL